MGIFDVAPLPQPFENTSSTIYIYLISMGFGLLVAGIVIAIFFIYRAQKKSKSNDKEKRDK